MSRFSWILCLATLLFAPRIFAETYECRGESGWMTLRYSVTLTEIPGLAEEPLFHMKVVNTSGAEGKTTSGMAQQSFNHGPYSYDRVSRYYELNQEVLAVNPETGKVTFRPNMRLAMPLPCTKQ